MLAFHYWLILILIASLMAGLIVLATILFFGDPALEETPEDLKKRIQELEKGLAQLREKK